MVAMINDHHGHGRLMVMAVMVVMGGSQDRKDRQEKLTVKLDFPGNLCRATFAILAIFDNMLVDSCVFVLWLWGVFSF